MTAWRIAARIFACAFALAVVLRPALGAPGQSFEQNGHEISVVWVFKDPDVSCRFSRDGKALPVALASPQRVDVYADTTASHDPIKAICTKEGEAPINSTITWQKMLTQGTSIACQQPMDLPADHPRAVCMLDGQPGYQTGYPTVVGMRSPAK